MKKIIAMLMAALFVSALVGSIAAADTTAPMTGTPGNPAVKAVKSDIKADKAKLKADRAKLKAMRKAKRAKKKAAKAAAVAAPAAPAGTVK